MLFYFLTKKSNKVFNERMVIIFTFNSFIGPDLFKIPRVFLFPDNTIILGLDHFLHSVLGWCIWSFTISLVFWQLSNIKAKYPDAMTYFNTVKVIASAGLMHLGIDVFDTSHVGVYSSLRFIPWLEETRFNFDTFHTGWNYTEGLLTLPSTKVGIVVLFLIGLGFLFLISFFMLKKRIKMGLISALAFFLVIITLIILFGSQIVYREHDLGYFIYLALFYLVPLGLLYWARQDTRVEMNPRLIYENGWRFRK